MILLHIFYNSLSLASYLSAAYDKSTIIKLLIQDYPNAQFYIENLSCVMLHPKASWPSSLVHVSVALFCFTISIPIVGILIYKTIEGLNRNRQYMSAISYRMHKRMLKVLVFQLLIPTCTVIIPSTTAIFIWYMSSEAVPQGTVQIGFILATTHSFTNAMMMLYFFPVYRKGFTEEVNSFGRRFAKVSSTAVNTMNRYLVK